jgi:O-methyltransferase
LNLAKTMGPLLSGARKAVRFARYPMRFPTYSESVQEEIERRSDDVRYASLALAIERIRKENIPGAFAELGVFQGHTSRFMHQQAPERRLYLFDTFKGFPEQIPGASRDTRFRNTSQEAVARFIGNLDHVIFRTGYFPDTARGLEDERFALIMLDCDMYQPALDGLRFFYPRLAPGGYFFLHDFNSPESDHGIERAASEFLAEKAEALIEVPDHWGSAVFRKLREGVKASGQTEARIS